MRKEGRRSRRSGDVIISGRQPRKQQSAGDIGRRAGCSAGLAGFMRSASVKKRERRTQPPGTVEAGVIRLPGRAYSSRWRFAVKQGLPAAQQCANKPNSRIRRKDTKYGWRGLTGLGIMPVHGNLPVARDYVGRARILRTIGADSHWQRARHVVSSSKIV
jgi:hypothetical protein